MTPATAYPDLTDEQQAQALRPVALAGAEQFGLPVDRLEVIRHSYNTTFALDTGDGRRYALRINTNSRAGTGEILAQQLWQVAIAHDTSVLVPTPRPTTQGRWWASVDSQALGREVLVTCASWLEGPDVETPDAQVAYAMGRTTALLHEHARGWELPVGASLPVFDSPLFGDPDRLTSARELDAGQREVLRRALEVAGAAFGRVYAGAGLIPLHADLHGANVKWDQGRLAVFDFDDAGLGVPVLDLAISTFYLRGGPGDPEPEAALREGYASVTDLPTHDPADVEAMVAARQLLLANDLLLTSTTQLRDMARTYLPLSVERLRHWLDTGHFTRIPAAE